MKRTFRSWMVFLAAPVFVVAFNPHASVPAQPAALALKRIALTFDDGPRPEFTDQLISLMERENVRGTFFLVGQQARKYPDLVRALADRGHEIANHSWSHPSVRTLNEENLKKELDRTRLFFRELIGRDTPLFRAPGGTVEYLRNGIVVPEGYRMVLWTVHSMDHERPSAETIRERVLEGMRDGAVVLFHTGVESTLQALPGLIETLKSHGYEFVTVSELLSGAALYASAPSAIRLPVD